MHARIDHLLSLRDHEPTESWVADHVEHCPTCAAALRRLGDVRTRLQSLAPMDAPAGSFDAIRARMSEGRPPAWQRKLRYAAAAVSLLVLGTVVAVVVRQDGQLAQDPSMRVATREPDPAPGIVELERMKQLVAQSQHLESLLQALPERPQIERVSTAATIDTIEQRIQWLDFQLSYANEQGLSEQQSQRLWSERVELMDSLLKVRSAESGGISF
jgi:hypothetical protein